MKVPALGDTLPAAQPSQEAIDLLSLRRSCPANFLGDPGPSPETLADILTIAARARDHRRVTPFRFIVFEGEARKRFGDILGAAFVATEPAAEDKKIEIERNRFMRAPVVVAVVSSVDREHRTPEWEQVLTAGAVCQNLLLAASAHGFAAQWITEWYAYDQRAVEALELKANERVAGFVYIGAAKELPKERARPDIQAITRYY
ncbi:MAG: nitroreductase family protein [Hyphococcus sp.]